MAKNPNNTNTNDAPQTAEEQIDAAKLEDVVNASKGGGTVLVGSKLPWGFMIRLVDGREVEINGANASAIIGGYGVTAVDKDVAEAWFAENKTHKSVMNGLLFIANNAKDAEKKAVESHDVAPGNELDGLNAQKPLGADVKVEQAKD